MGLSRSANVEAGRPRPCGDPVSVETRSMRAAAAARASRQRGRRRNIDPTTSDRRYTFAEVEFAGAMQQYKQAHGRPFPTLSEVLEVIGTLGYKKRATEAAL